jgi:hypothetical protein
MSETLFTLKGLLKKQQKTIAALQKKNSNVVSTGVNTSAAVPTQVESCKDCEMALFAKDEMATSLGDAYEEIARLKTAQKQSSELITRMRELCADKEEQTASLLEECASQKASEARLRRILTQTREVMGAQESFIDSMRRSRRFQQRLDESEGGEEAYDEYLDRKHDLELRPEEGNAGEGQRDAKGRGDGWHGGLRTGEGRYSGPAADRQEEEGGCEEKNGVHEDGEEEEEEEDGKKEEEEEGGEAAAEGKSFFKRFAQLPPPTYRRPPLPSSTGPSLSPRGSERRDGRPTYDERDYSGRDKEEDKEEEKGEDVLPFGVTSVETVSREDSPTRRQQQQQQQQHKHDEDIGVGWDGREDEPPPPAPPVDDIGSDSDVEPDRAQGGCEGEREGENEGYRDTTPPFPSEALSQNARYRAASLFRGQDRDDGNPFHHQDASYMSDLSVDSVAGRAVAAVAFRSVSTGRGGASSDEQHLADKLLADGVDSVEDSFSLIQQYYASIN